MKKNEQKKFLQLISGSVCRKFKIFVKKKRWHVSNRSRDILEGLSKDVVSRQSIPKFTFSITLSSILRFFLSSRLKIGFFCEYFSKQENKNFMKCD